MGIRSDGTHSRGNPRICFRLDKETEQAVKKRCKETGDDISKYVRKLVQRDIEETRTPQNE